MRKSTRIKAETAKRSKVRRTSKRGREYTLRAKCTRLVDAALVPLPFRVTTLHRCVTLLYTYGVAFSTLLPTHTRLNHPPLPLLPPEQCPQAVLMGSIPTLRPSALFPCPS